MTQYTITYRTRYGAKFAFVVADSVLSAKRLILDSVKGSCTILTVRENNPPLPTITSIQAS